jgi:Asp/Glu/hydantoin racemase
VSAAPEARPKRRLAHAGPGGLERDSTPLLGVLILEDSSFLFPGCLGHPGTFAFPSKAWRVPGATKRRTVHGDRSLGPAFVDGARALVADGATAITTNCGFAALFQREIASAVTVPVFTSSLMFVPTLARMLGEGRKVGILTFDSRYLTEDHFREAGWSSDDIAVVIAGVEKQALWSTVVEPDVTLATETLEQELVAVADVFHREHPDIGLFVLECAGFAPFARTVRARVGVPTYDIVTLAEAVVRGSG